MTGVSKRLFNIKDAAQYMGRTPWGIRELVWAGHLPVVKPASGRKIFIDVVDMDKFIEENKARYL